MNIRQQPYRLIRRLLLLALTGVGVWLFHDLPDPRTYPAWAEGPTTKIYDRHGTLLYEVLPPSETAGSRTPLPFDRFPAALRQATIATEDAGFYSHPGVEWRGILRAAWLNLRASGVAAGGSTITQQVARTILLAPQERQERTFRRKVREAVLALWIERLYTKDEILALYLNHAYYGNLAYGAEAAAQSYFRKHVWELDAAECALLAGLPQAPGAYNPLTNLDAAKARQATVLRLMVRAGAISHADADLAAIEPLHFAATPFEIEAPHFVMWVVQQAESRYGAALVDGSGLRITTTLDLGMQDIAEGIVRRRLAQLAGRERGELDRNVRNAAVVALDPATGQVLAMVGSPDYFDASIDGAVNVALMPRQPGSALKPFTYATAFDPARAPAGRPWAPATVVSDVPTTFQTADGKLYHPENYDRRHHGPISLREALATSNNLVAVKVLDHVGVGAMLQTARDVGITTLTDPARYDLTVTLGGGEVTLLELTAAYNTLAAGGIARAPVAILRTTDASGRLLDEWQPTPGRPALDPRVVALITDILSDPMARAPTFGEWNALRLPRPAAAKTGTTTDWRDNWTLGYSPDLTVGVWVGNANNEPMRTLSGVEGAGPIWQELMMAALRQRPPTPFPRVTGVEPVEICAASGLLPDTLCPQRRRDLFLAGHAPTAHDQSYRQVTVDLATGLLAAPGCAGPSMPRLFRIPPPEAVAWAQAAGWPLPPTQRCDGAIAHAETGGTASGPLIAHPAPGSIYRLDPALPRGAQRLPLSVRASDGVATARGRLLLDGAVVATFEQLPFELLWPLVPGSHTLTAEIDGRDGQPRTSPPVTFSVEP